MYRRSLSMLPWMAARQVFIHERIGMIRRLLSVLLRSHIIYYAPFSTSTGLAFMESTLVMKSDPGSQLTKTKFETLIAEIYFCVCSTWPRGFCCILLTWTYLRVSQPSLKDIGLLA